MTAAAPCRPRHRPRARRRGALELQPFFREKDAVVFTFALPVILLLIFGTIFEPAESSGTGVAFTPVLRRRHHRERHRCRPRSMSLGIGIAAERDDGTLKRLRGTPMPPRAYFLGKIVCVVARRDPCEPLLLLALGVLLFGLSLPTTAERWADVRLGLRARGRRPAPCSASRSTSAARVRPQRRRRAQPARPRAAVHLRGLLRLRRPAAVACSRSARSSR